jgi:hypothetical protein
VQEQLQPRSIGIDALAIAAAFQQTKGWSSRFRTKQTRQDVVEP